MANLFDDVIGDGGAAATFLSFVLPNVVMVVGVEIEVRHEIRLHVINRFGECFQELVEVFLVEEDLVPVIPVLIEFFTAFGNGKIVVVATCCPHIKEVRSAFASPDALAVNAFHSFFVVVVRHNNFF